MIEFECLSFHNFEDSIFFLTEVSIKRSPGPSLSTTLLVPRNLNSVKPDNSLAKMKKSTCFSMCIYIFQCQNLISVLPQLSIHDHFYYCLLIDGFLSVYSLQILKLRFLNFYSFLYPIFLKNRSSFYL